jgi:outer membrane scaffolding protein for murein synthesis (MipA/OmpV family)
MRTLRLGFALGFLLPAAGLAQTAAPDYTLLGAGIRSRPAYDGSRSQETEVIPVLRYYGKPWFARTTQGILEGGARWALSPRLILGAQLAYEQGRKSSESAFLQARNAANLAPGASVGVHLESDQNIGPVPLTMLLRLRQNMDSARGSQIDVRLTAGVYASGPLALGVFGQATWGSGKSVRTFYAQPGFAPGGGPMFTSVGALGSYDLSRRWVLVSSLEGRRLRGESASSPLVERRTNHYASAGLAYRF